MVSNGFITLFLLVIFSLCAKGDLFISEDEDVELEKQLKILNKPPIKTIQDVAGGIFDCIDIYKQPAFDHPLLKDHKLQMEPTSLPDGLAVENLTKSSLPAPKGLSCPQGTVPIRRTTKEDLIRGKAFFQQNYPTLGDRKNAHYPGLSLALVRTPIPSYKKFYNIEGTINLQNPRVTGDQSSTGQLFIQSEIPEPANAIQAGWMVAPSLFGDTLTHLFISWKGIDSGCYNVLCSGFVQQNSNYAVGMVLNHSSQYDLRLQIVQDKATKDWWLIDKTTSVVKVGYWPWKLLPLLAHGGTLLGWGGMASGPVNGESPPMGKGSFPDKYDFRASCYIGDIYYSTDEADHKLPKDRYLEADTDSPDCYDAKDFGYQGEDIGYVIQFGGPGGHCGV